MENKETRSTPNIPHNIRSPHGDDTILNFYNGHFDCVYIILHPFYKNISTVEKLSWAEFLLLSGLENINRLDIALRSSIGGLVKIHHNESDLAKLQNTADLNNIMLPEEGNFSSLLIDDMLKTLLSLGHEWLYIGDEFGFERRIVYIRDIIGDHSDVNLHHESWYTTKGEVLYATHWDSHYTLLCSDRRTIERILEDYPFEGFFCDNRTKIYWSVSG
ncbi:hypothetical protein GCM10023149_20010 [Mucilaginibacter gynuensis]|uniref:DUF2711 family protein n=1 Tax=Mucilaginibacter gynuensis TaxID=1302236 RepID=A0ABP8GAJ2_9SPHI